MNVVPVLFLYVLPICIFAIILMLIPTDKDKRSRRDK